MKTSCRPARRPAADAGSHVAGNSSEQRRGCHARAEHAVLDLRQCLPCHREHIVRRAWQVVAAWRDPAARRRAVQEEAADGRAAACGARASILQIERRETRLASCGVHVRLDPPPRARGDKANREITFRGRRAALDVRRRPVERLRVRSHVTTVPNARVRDGFHSSVPSKPRTRAPSRSRVRGRGWTRRPRRRRRRPPAPRPVARPAADRPPLRKDQRLLLDVVVNGVAEDRSSVRNWRARYRTTHRGEAVFGPDLFHGVIPWRPPRPPTCRRWRRAPPRRTTPPRSQSRSDRGCRDR